MRCIIRNCFAATLLIAALIILCSGAAFAQPGLVWKSLGPTPILNAYSGTGYNLYVDMSGRVATIACHPTDPNTIYMGAASGGVWKTTDGGVNWAPLTDNQASLAIGAIALAPNNPNILYVGTGIPMQGSATLYGHGVLKSTDGGMTWTLLPGNAGKNEFDRRTISKIVVDPMDSNTVYLTIGPTQYNSLSGKTGVWKSTDGGSIWTNMTASASSGINDNTDVFWDLVMDPSNHLTLYTAVGNDAGSSKSGVYKTTDGGTTWSLAGNLIAATGQPATNIARTALALAPSGPQTLYASVAGTSSYNNNGLLALMLSTDGGATWTKLANTPDFLGTASYAQGSFDNILAVNPTNPNNVFAGGEAGDTYGIIESTNGGTSWFDITKDGHGQVVHTDHHAMAFDANGKLLDGNDGGIWRLDSATKGSLQWSDLNPDLTITEFYGVALDPTNRLTAYGGSQDNGFEKFTGGVGWNENYYTDGYNMRVDFSNPSTVYGTTVGGADGGNDLSGVVQRSDDGGNTWNEKDTGVGLTDVSNFPMPFVMDASNSQRLLLGTNHVYETTNRGDSWTAIGTPGVNGFGLSSSNALDCVGTVGNTIYASGVGHIWVTINDGASWTQRDIPGVGAYFCDIAVNPSNPQEAYTVHCTFGGGKVYHTTNAGASWTDITGNLPDLPANTIKRHPVTGALYVGMDRGIYVSTNNGASWSALGIGLPNAAILDLDLEPSSGLLVAATHGRGAWQIGVDGMDFSVSDVAIGSDGLTRLLWNDVNGQMIAWSVNDSNGTFTYGPLYGPYLPFIATNIACGSDGLTRVLWNDGNGNAALWWLKADDSLLVFETFGPYPGWTATDVSVGSDNQTRILWTRNDGVMTVWTLNNNGSFTYGPLYGPYLPFLATNLACGNDGKTRVVWNTNDGSGNAALWEMDAAGNRLAYYNYGPYVGWQVADVGVGSDGLTRLLWTDSPGNIEVWSVNDSNGSFTYGPGYGPYTGFVANRLTSGANALTNVLWNANDGRTALWNVSASNAFQMYYLYGPY